jgi:Predicted pPIWI-associating nuclease
MPDTVAALEQLSQDAYRLQDTIKRCRTKRVNTELIRPTARAMARSYFEDARPELLVVQQRAGLVDEIDYDIQEILQLSSSTQNKTRYGKLLRELRLFLSEATLNVLKFRGENRLVLSALEAGILETLAKMLPPAAGSYEQTLRDIRAGERVSWRGPANEFREVLREVIDYLAPDRQVMDSTGYQPDGDRSVPTQRQKVRFILRNRKSGTAAIGVAETSLDAVEEAVAVLARSTYQRSNVSTHTATGGSEIRNLKRYVDALLGELLEIRA